MARRWFTELRAGGHGPHWYLATRFAEGHAARLRDRVRAALRPAGFRVHEVQRKRRLDDATLATYDLYVDRDGFTDMVSLVERGTLLHSHGYVAVTVEGVTLDIQRLYGGASGPGDERCAAGEDDLLRRLCADPELALAAWCVNAGGDGYDPFVAARGQDAASLLAYLDGGA